MDGYNKHCITCIFFSCSISSYSWQKKNHCQKRATSMQSIVCRPKKNPKTQSAYFSNNTAQNHHRACFKKVNFSQGNVSCTQHNLTVEVGGKGLTRSPDYSPCTNGTVSHAIQLSEHSTHQDTWFYWVRSVKTLKTTNRHKNRYDSLVFFKLFQTLTMQKPEKEHTRAWQCHHT